MTTFVVVGVCPLNFAPMSLDPSNKSCLRAESDPHSTKEAAERTALVWRSCVESPAWDFLIERRES